MQPFSVPQEIADGPRLACAGITGGGRTQACTAYQDSSDNATPRTPKARGVCVSGPARRAGIPRQGRTQTPGGADMFEGQPQAEIDALMKRDPEFRQLYQRHRTLDKKVMDAELGVLPIDDVTLGQMKREKLHAKEKLLRIYDRAH